MGSPEFESRHPPNPVSIFKKALMRAAVSRAAANSEPYTPNRAASLETLAVNPNPAAGRELFPAEPDEEKGIEEARSEHHQSETPPDSRVFQGVDTDYLRSLEEVIISLKLQLIMAKARAVRAEQKVDLITQEADEPTELLIRHLDD
ncbi:unnamed protein product [Lactuca saligna]|uniref:Uncharacterized protein n=1 Tax=Lactuca saligna TaxID=75948 RepID=A0AA36EBV4_LACSI|nr:unnamed protein product [Lactuca saligna]